MTTLWLALTIACLIWYSSVTVAVAIMGFKDIFSMLQQIKEDHARQNQAD